MPLNLNLRLTGLNQAAHKMTSTTIHEIDQDALIDTYIKLNHRHEWGAMRERCAEAPKEFNQFFDGLYNKYAAAAPQLDQLNDEEMKTWLSHFAKHVDAKHGDILSYPDEETIWFWHKTLGPIRQTHKNYVPPEFRVGEGKDEFHIYHWYDAAGGDAQYALFSDALNKKICSQLVKDREATRRFETRWRTVLTVFNEKITFNLYDNDGPIHSKDYSWQVRYGDVNTYSTNLN